MNLDIFNNLLNKSKDNNAIQNFIKEITETLNDSLRTNKENQLPLVDRLLDGKTLTTKYRDEIKVQRHEIINNYSKENSEQGELYYVYNKRSDNTYGVVMHKNGETGNSISVQENQMPDGVGVDTVLRLQNNKFILDQTATEELQAELTQMIKKLLEQQETNLKSQRIEGHFYEFIEKSGNTVWLLDQTDDSKGCFQEIEFPTELAEKATKGTRFQYVNGVYCTVNK